LVILLVSGDLLVRGAVNLSLRLGIPALIVSLTIVAFGTSAPELLVTVQAIMEGAPGLAFGNAIGSNTANVLLVLGLPALIACLHTSHIDTRKSYVFMMLGTAVFAGFCLMGPLGPLQGVVLLGMLFAMLWAAGRSANKSRLQSNASKVDDVTLDEADPCMSSVKISLYLALGLVGLPLGAGLLVDSSSDIARSFGISDAVIGLTLVAIGTSLPELSTTVMAAIRGKADVALGNVIGSNMFNLLAVMGVASFFGPLHVPPGILHLDIWVMIGASLLLAPFVLFRADIGRVWGLALTTLYVTYMVVVLS
jgi:cation:H+ antiporter